MMAQRRPGYTRTEATIAAAADREIVPGILFAALNLSYGFGEVRNYSTGLYLDGSELAFSAAATARLWEDVYLGGEVRYRRGFDALAFGNLTGQAVFLGADLLRHPGKGGIPVRRLEHSGLGADDGPRSDAGRGAVPAADVQTPPRHRPLEKRRTERQARGTRRQARAPRPAANRQRPCMGLAAPKGRAPTPCRGRI